MHDESSKKNEGQKKTRRQLGQETTPYERNREELGVVRKEKLKGVFCPSDCSRGDAEVHSTLFLPGIQIYFFISGTSANRQPTPALTLM